MALSAQTGYIVSQEYEIYYAGLGDKRNTQLNNTNTRSSADAEKSVRRIIIRREEKYRQLVGRRTAV